MVEVRELPELIASLRADHVEKSVRLFADDDFDNQMRSLINERSQRLFADQDAREVVLSSLLLCATNGSRPIHEQSLPTMFVAPDLFSSGISAIPPSIRQTSS